MNPRNALLVALISIAVGITGFVTLGSVSGAAPTVRFAVIGDYGCGPIESPPSPSCPQDDTGDIKVANLVKTWKPVGRPDWNVQFVVTLGDNCYGASPKNTFVKNIGPLYKSRFGPNSFFPTLGNHEYGDCGGIEAYRNYFTTGADFTSLNPVKDVAPGYWRYYTFKPPMALDGPVRFFVLNSNLSTIGSPDLPSVCTNNPQTPTPTEPCLLAASQAGGQARWLRDGLRNSATPWKVVLMHHPPLSSGGGGSGSGQGSSVWMQWPLKAWGAHAVLAGHHHGYERLFCDDLPFFVNGLGGAAIYNYDRDPACGSQVRYGKGSRATHGGNTATHGAMFVEASNDWIHFRFVHVTGTGTTGTQIDELKLVKNNPAEATISLQDGVFPSSTYAGTQDTYISQKNPTARHGLSGSTLRVDGNEENNALGSDLAALVKWNLSPIPAPPPGKRIRVTKATITLTVVNPTGPDVGKAVAYRVLRLKRSWCEGTVTWNEACAGQNWGKSGALDSDGVLPDDTGATSYLDVSKTPVGIYSFPLNTVVQKWVDKMFNGDSTGFDNHGIIMRDQVTQDGFEFHSRHASTPGYRPKLTITYRYE